MIRKTMLSVIELSKQVLFAWTLSAICVATFTACDVESECDVIGYTVEDRSSNVWTLTCRYKRPVTNGDEVFTCRFLLNIETGEVVML